MTKLDPLGPVAVLSPHLDDAVFSCGHFMKSHPSITVVTAMAGAPDVLHDGYNSTTTDKPYAPDAVGLRRDEDRAAVEFLGATPIWLDLLDSDYAQYRPPGDYVPAISAKITRALDDARPASVFAPLGLIHSDHIAVSDASRALWVGSNYTWYLYMDLPYGIAHARVVKRRLRVLRRRVDLVELDADGGDHTVKQQAMALYRSQFEPTRRNYGEAFDASMQSTERYWRVTPRH